MATTNSTPSGLRTGILGGAIGVAFIIVIGVFLALGSGTPEAPGAPEPVVVEVTPVEAPVSEEVVVEAPGESPSEAHTIE